MDDKRTYYLEVLQKLCSEEFVEKQPLCFKENLPLIRIQLGYFFHLLNYNKLRRESLAAKSEYVKHSAQTGLLSQIKWKLKLSQLKRNYKNILSGKIMLFGFNEHYYEGNVNLYLSPFKAELEKKSIPHTEFLISNNGTVKHQSELNKLYRHLYDHHHLSRYESERDAIVNAEIIKNFLTQENIPHAEHVGNIIYKAQIEQQVKFITFLDFLKITKPKLIWTYVYYDNAVTALIRAANKLSIRTVEYQHSVQSDKHFAYAKWQNAGYYKDFFPNTFWGWSKNDSDRILRNFSDNSFKPEVITGGNISVLQQKELYEIADKQHVKGILVSLQGTWIPKFLEHVIEQDNDYKWYFRLHPRYPEDKTKLNAFKERFPEKIETEAANRLTLYELFNKVNFSVTDFSGVALEAAQFGIQNIIVGQAGSEVYTHEIIDGTFKLALNENDFKKSISDTQTTGIGSTQQSRERLDACLTGLLADVKQV